MENEIGDYNRMKIINKKLNILFIDDLKEKDKQYTAIEKLKDKINCDIKPLILNNKSVTEFINELFKNNEPDIILMDHKLTEMSDQNVTGASLTELIRDKWTKIPIVGVTNIDIENGIPESKKVIYDEIIQKDELIKNKFLIIDSIARNYLALNDIYSKSKNIVSDNAIKKSIASCLGASDDDLEKIFKIIPQGLVKNYNKPDFISLLARWIRREFIKQPGFVYDSLWIATILGIKELSFLKIKNKFKEATYHGPFYTEKELWWKTKVLKLVYNLIKDNVDILPYILEKKFKEIKSKDFVHCENCNELFPEIVGYKDDSLEKRVPLHIKCSLPTDKVTPKLFYEDIRIMEGE